MKILVLGKHGQLGSELLARASENGVEAQGYGSADLNVTVERAFREALASEKPDWVINTTARNGVPDCEKNFQAALDVHAAAVRSMSVACTEHEVGFVTFSTDYVFDGEKGAPYVEDDPPNPLQTYGITKETGERFCRRYCENGLILRACGVYGGETGSRAKEGGNFVLNILRQSKSRGEIEVSSEQIVNPVYAVDLARATLELVERKPAGGIYHLAGDDVCSWAEFASAIVEIAGSKSKIVPVDLGGRSGSLRRPKFSALANVKAKQLGVRLPNWRSGLERYVPWLLEKGRPAP